MSNLKEENTLLKQEKEALNHRIVEQAKEMTGKAHVGPAYCTPNNLRPRVCKLQLCLFRLASIRFQSSRGRHSKYLVELVGEFVNRISLSTNMNSCLVNIIYNLKK